MRLPNDVVEPWTDGTCQQATPSPTRVNHPFEPALTGGRRHVQVSHLPDYAPPPLTRPSSIPSKLTPNQTVLTKRHPTFSQRRTPKPHQALMPPKHLHHLLDPAKVNKRRQTNPITFRVLTTTTLTFYQNRIRSNSRSDNLPAKLQARVSYPLWPQLHLRRQRPVRRHLPAASIGPGRSVLGP